MTIEAPVDWSQTEEAQEVRDAVAKIDDGGLAKSPTEREIFRYLRIRQQLETEATRIADQTAAMIRDLQRRIALLDTIYTPIARDYTANAVAGKKTKSVKTPFGTMGFRTVAANLEVLDSGQALAWAKLDESRAALIRTKEELAKAELNKVFDATGEVPPGCNFVAAHEKFYVK